MEVWCDMDTDGGGWTVFQRRVDGSEDFFRYWADYKAGFGELAVEHWLGNDNIYALVNNGKTYELRLDLSDGIEWKYDLYASFVISDEASGYTLTLGANIDGDAGNSFSNQNRQAFTTRDADHDSRGGENCAITYKGGWWYSACHWSNLNGLYLNGTHYTYAVGINYVSWKGHHYSLAATEMKLRPAAP
ncbi:ficolin-2-like [Amphiura filiformis]|uniref:ficolin-2-like n=1 Tax=Amphiura filiformis TaxID=82378 RepID=UPI003B220BC3